MELPDTYFGWLVRSPLFSNRNQNSHIERYETQRNIVGNGFFIV